MPVDSNPQITANNHENRTEEEGYAQGKEIDM
jgi:hypothetical protein